VSWLSAAAAVPPAPTHTSLNCQGWLFNVGASKSTYCSHRGSQDKQRKHRRHSLGLRATDGNTGDTARSAEDSHTSETGSMFANLRIAVVGAGPVGLLTAIALARRGHRQIKVYDRLSEPPAPEAQAWGDPERSYNLGIGGRGQRAMTRFGVMERVDKWSQTVVGRKDWSAKGEPPKVTINNRRYLTKVIARDRLSSCLYEEIQEKYPSVQVEFSVECEDVRHSQDQKHPKMSLELERCVPQIAANLDEEEGCEIKDNAGPFDADADVVIGADGVASSVRSALVRAGVPANPTRFEDRRPIVYRILAIPVPEGERTDLNYSARSGGIIVEALPNVEGQLLGVVLYKPTDERMQDLKSGAEAKALFEELFPEWPTPLINDAEWEAFAGRKTRQLPQFAFSGPELSLGGSVCLVGDAIHSVKPFFGLGLNSGFEDISVLDECLEEAGDDFVSALPLYSMRRAPQAECLVRLQRRFDQPTDLRFALAFVLPIVLDSIFHKMLPSVFAPGTLALCQDGEFSFTQIRRRKFRDRVAQAIVLGTIVLAVGALTTATARGTFFLLRKAFFA